jgi:hypothetical protein
MSSTENALQCPIEQASVRGKGLQGVQGNNIVLSWCSCFNSDASAQHHDRVAEAGDVP